MERSGLKSVLMNPALTEDQRLAIETCPGFNKALDRALEPYNYYERVKCGDCQLKVTVNPLGRRAGVSGECPKI